MDDAPATCHVIGANGPNLEPIRCAYAPGHDGPHSIDSLPTFFNGFTALERAAIEFVEASSSDEYALHQNDPKHPAWQRRMDALDDLHRFVDEALSTAALSDGSSSTDIGNAHG